MIYSPREDSYLLQEQVKIFSKNKSVLDIGTGSGIQALSAKSAGAKSVIASDIDLISLNYAKHKLKKANILAIHSNLFEKIRGKFDLIVFNPPYLPKDKREDEDSARTTSGGKKGDEIILRFLSDAIKHLNKNGDILLVISSLTPPVRINRLIKKLKLKKKVLSTKHFFFEEISVLKFEKKA